MDRLTKDQRKRNMQAVKNKNSRIEQRLAKALWAKGYRYRKNVATVHGKPDIAFLGLKIAIFCDSEFWHGKDWDTKKYELKSNREFWFKKIEGNIERDKNVNEVLQQEGWQVLRFWGKDIEKRLEYCINEIETIIKQTQ
jgi:DNA mismatch endonuclease Vsr